MARITATYRLQLREHFGFGDVAALADYFAALGVSHVYLSPILQAELGTAHGYDVVDHARISEELGGAAGFVAMCDELAAHGIGVVVDVVPNHMAIGTPRNRWWWDVLENGPDSPFAEHFDIDWDFPEPRQRNKIVVPILGDTYGRALEMGDIRIDRSDADFEIAYSDHRLPVAPDSYASILETAANRSGSSRLAFIATSFRKLRASATSSEKQRVRRRENRHELRLLLENALEDAALREAVDHVIAATNLDPFALDAFVQNMNFRLAHWRCARDEIDYRRFFDVSSLAALRVDDPFVFADTHQRIFELLEMGCIDGLRIDHPDGLRDPERYLELLSTHAPNAWIVVEKILDRSESLPAWPVAGTTGYDFTYYADGLLVDTGATPILDRLYRELTGDEASYEEIVRTAKRQIIREVFNAETMALTERLMKANESSWRWRDHSRREAQRAIEDVLVEFAVYRTYASVDAAGATTRSIHDADPVYDAIARARTSGACDHALYDRIGELLLRRDPSEEAVCFAERFAQLSVPVVAKGVEDTAFYRYTRFIAANEVGGYPGHLGVSIDAFHEHNSKIADRWPRTMVSTSTHDTKRSEDVRARLAVLSEIPDLWAATVKRWFCQHAGYTYGNAPSNSMRYLIYQTLVGAYPLSRDRAHEYFQKAAREAKLETSWLDPDTRYETQLHAFIDELFDDAAFCRELSDLVGDIAEAGRVNSLAQVVLKLTSPGIPDIYQGAELWTDSLVDPDNRRPVDYALRQRLVELDRPATASLRDIADTGALKLWVTRRLLAERQRHDLTSCGYRPIASRGSKADHVIAYQRDDLVAVVPRLWRTVAGRWEDTAIGLPPGAHINSFTSTPYRGAVRLADLFAELPVAVLTRV